MEYGDDLDDRLNSRDEENAEDRSDKFCDAEGDCKEIIKDLTDKKIKEIEERRAAKKAFRILMEDL